MASNSKILNIAKELRKNMTIAEKVFWQEIRNRKFYNLKFRRQMPLVFGDYHFIADFYCSEKKLIIEIDGNYHEDIETKEYDDFREDILKTAGYKIFRATNHDVIYNIDKVLDKLSSFIK